MINAGILDRHITIQQITQTRDAVGGVINTPSNYKTVWAGKRYIRANEKIESDQQVASRIVEWTIRTLDAPLLDESMQILEGSTVYEIEGVKTYGRQETTKILTKQKI